MSLVVALLLIAFLGAVGTAWAIAYGARAVGAAIFEDIKDSDDHETSLSLARARTCLAMGPGPGVPPVSPVLGAQSGPRDPVIGLDAARAEVRARIHRYNAREVK